MYKIILIAMAGAIGALARYGLAGLSQRLSGSTAFPVGTAVVNMLGCFAFGLVWGLLEDKAGLSGHLRVILLTGFMGAFTTYSTYMFETANLLTHGQGGWAAVNVAGQNLAGLALVFTGLALGRAL